MYWCNTICNVISKIQYVTAIQNYDIILLLLYLVLKVIRGTALGIYGNYRYLVSLECSDIFCVHSTLCCYFGLRWVNMERRRT